MRNIVFCLVLVLTCCSYTQSKCDEAEINEKDAEKTVVERHGQLSVRGTHLVNTKGEKVVLKGVSFGWHNWWPRFYNAKAVETLATDWQCDVVRASIGVDPERGFIREPAFSTGKWKDEELKEWGQIVKKEISHNN